MVMTRHEFDDALRDWYLDWPREFIYDKSYNADIHMKFISLLSKLLGNGRWL
jgi:hypothetical protein